MYDAVIISDLHLGSSACQEDQLLRFLQGLPPTRLLILNGDVLDDAVVRLSRKQARVLSVLRDIVDGDRTKVVWLRGNHDWDCYWFANLVGAIFTQEWLIDSGDCRILVLHGDVFDEFIDKHPVVTLLAEWSHRFLCWVSPRLASFAKRNCKSFRRCCELVRERAIGHVYGYAGSAHTKSNGICCGHTHQAEDTLAFGIGYYNSGCWTERVCHYLTVQDGVVQLRVFSGE